MPRCSRCSAANCKCVQLYKKHTKQAEVPDSNIEVEDSSESNSFLEDQKEIPHYEQRDVRYGCNTSRIIYPLYSDPRQSAAIQLKQSPDYKYPAHLIPQFSPANECRHGELFIENDEYLKICAEQIVLYEESKETIYDCKVYYRETVGQCKCRQHYDGHELLMYHMGQGRMICYFTLQNYLHNWVNSGLTKYAAFKSIQNNRKSTGSVTSLYYHMWYKAVDGFVLNLSFDYAECFSCTNCGIDPLYFVGDGKCLGPLQKKFTGLNIKELSSHPDDSTVLEQGSKFSERTLLASKKERDLICNLLTGNEEMESFVNSGCIKSENGKMVQDLVRFIQAKWPLKIPEQFITFLADISKSSSIAGLLQVRSSKPLTFLKQFCLEQLDIRSPAESRKLDIINSEIPTFWPQLVSICELNKSKYPPNSVSKIVLRMIKIRRDTFKNTPQRYQEDYFSYEKEGIYKEDQTQFYPNHPLDQYPKLYTVSGNDDKDHCHKNFSTHTEFIDGIFSMGCCCKFATYGFELLCATESARHFFRFLMCRKINFSKLEGVIEDFACGLHPYALNREPTQLQYLQFLVERSHRQGQRRLTKTDYCSARP